MDPKNKITRIFLIAVLCGAFSGITQGRAEDDLAAPAVKTYTWKDKIKRGGLNIVSSPVEIARQIQITSSEEDLLHGWTVGLVEGLGQGLIRLGAGVVDVLTCPFDFPEAGKVPLIDPEYVWQKPGVKYKN